MRRVVLLVAAVVLCAALAVAVSLGGAGRTIARVASSEPATCVSADFSKDCATGNEYPYPGRGLPAVTTVAP